MARTPAVPGSLGGLTPYRGTRNVDRDMSVPATCPRCAGPLRAPGFWSSAWHCERHGDVNPFHAAAVPALAAVERLVADSRVPVWVPRPLPLGWTVTGVGRAGDERTGVVGSLIAV